jgi:glutathione S-transferase
MLPAAVWEKLSPEADYVAETLATEGFIHCTEESARLVEVANRFYRTAPGAFLILTLDVARLQSSVQWEWTDGHQFPHVYGPINLTAVVAVDPFPRAVDGTFLPPALAATTRDAEAH